jgi:hypothetical protein
LRHIPFAGGRMELEATGPVPSRSVLQSLASTIDASASKHRIKSQMPIPQETCPIEFAYTFRFDRSDCHAVFLRDGKTKPVVHLGLRRYLCAEFDLRIPARRMALRRRGNRLDRRSPAALVVGGTSQRKIVRLSSGTFWVSSLLVASLSRRELTIAQRSARSLDRCRSHSIPAASTAPALCSLSRAADIKIQRPRSREYPAPAP